MQKEKEFIGLVLLTLLTISCSLYSYEFKFTLSYLYSMGFESTDLLYSVLVKYIYVCYVCYGPYKLCVYIYI